MLGSAVFWTWCGCYHSELTAAVAVCTGLNKIKPILNLLESVFTQKEVGRGSYQGRKAGHRAQEVGQRVNMMTKIHYTFMSLSKNKVKIPDKEKMSSF